MAHQSEIEKLERRYEEKPSQWFAALAEEYRRAGDVDRALEIVRQGLKERSNYVSGYIVLARCLLQQENDEEASEVLTQVLDLDAENIIALKVLSEIRERVNDTAGAVSWLEKLLEVDPMNQDAQETLDRLRGGEAAPEESGVAEAQDGIETKKTDAAPDEVSGAAAVPAAEAGDLVVESSESAFGDDSQADLGGGVAVDRVVTEQAAVVFEGPEAPEVASSGVVPDEPEEPPPDVDQGIEDEVPVLETIPADPIVDTAGLGHEAEAPVAEVPAPEPGEGDQEPAVSDASVEVSEPAAEGAPSSFAPPSGQSTEAVVDDGEMPVAEESQAPDLPPVAEAPPEPLVTETMAQVFVSQGLYEEARGVYRQLIERQPDNTEFRDKLAELDRQGAAAAAPAASEQPYEASATGGVSSRAFLAGVVATAIAGPSREPPPASPPTDVPSEAQARESATALAGLPVISESEPAPPASPMPDSVSSGASTDQPVEPDPASSSEPPVEAESAPPSEPPTKPAASVPEGPSPLEEAFETPEPDEPAPGEPTQPASDSPSLSAVFDEEPPASSPPAASEESPPQAPKAGEGDLSYDEFFGGSAPPSEREGDQAADSPTPDTEDALEDRDFKDWLKGLKS